MFLELKSIYMYNEIEKNVAVLKLKIAALNNRAQWLITTTELVREYAQLTMVQQQQIDYLLEILKKNEHKNPDQNNPTIPGTPSTTS